MAIINISAEIKGSSKTTAQTIRKISASACLKGSSLSNPGRRTAPKKEKSN